MLTDSSNSLRLGDLETAVMNVVWEKGEATVHDVRAALAPQRDAAYTTVMTVMSRLAAKGVLRRRKSGRAYVYEPVAEQEQLAGSMLSGLVDRLYGGSSTRAIAHLLEAEESVTESELDRLELLIRQKRERP